MSIYATLPYWYFLLGWLAEGKGDWEREKGRERKKRIQWREGKREWLNY